MENETLTNHDYRDAITVQSACNLSGVVLSFARVMKKINNEARKLKKGTTWINNHPICRMYAEQINHLTAKNYINAYDECKKKST